MSVKAFIFDFDGMIVDSESPEYEAWRDLCAEHGVDLPFSVYQCSVGSSREAFDPIVYLEEKIGISLDRKRLVQNAIIRSYSAAMEKPILPGVMDYLVQAKERGIKLAIASSSPTDWVYCHLVRLKIATLFDIICCGDEVLKVKPQPDLFLLAAEFLKVRPDEAVVFEDSPNGITAAKAASMFCVAVPNFVTRTMVVDHADLIVNSLAELSIDQLLTEFKHRKQEL